MTGKERGRSAVLAAGGALLLVLGPAGNAVAQDDGDADPGSYVVAEDAEEIEGTASTADAPRVEAGGVYLDSLAPEDELYYSVVLDDESDYYVSAVAVPEPGAEVAFNDEFSMQLHTRSGDSCFTSSDRRFDSDDTSRPLGTAVYRVIESDADCQSGGDYLLSVERDSASTSDQGDWRLELRVMAEPPASGATEAPPERDWLLPEDVPPPPTDEPEEVSGGTGFNDAHPIAEGVWRDSIAPGETRFYRVPVDWHEQLVVVAELANSDVDDSMMSYTMDGLGIELYSPFQRLAFPAETETYDGAQASVASMTPPVAYDNRYDTDTEYVERSRVPGWYYVAVHVHRDVAEFVEDDTLGLTLRASLHGEAVAGPEYDGDFAESGFGVSDEDRDQAAAGKDDATVAAEKRDAQQLLGYSTLGAGVAVVLVLAVWSLVARRRAAATTSGADPGAGSGAAHGGPAPG